MKITRKGGVMGIGTGLCVFNFCFMRVFFFLPKNYIYFFNSGSIGTKRAGCCLP